MINLALMKEIIITFLLSYLLGSIPMGFIYARLIKGIDIRNYGSGNIGATNILRTLGKKAGLIVLIGDMGKGALAILFTRIFVGSNYELLAAAGALLGHSYPAFLRFKGGKIVATGGGIIFTILPWSGVIGLLVFGASVYTTGYVSLGSILAAISLPISFYLFHYPLSYVLFFGVVALFVIFKHRENIKRLMNGTEYKFKKK